jgi:fumarate reductase subunit C
MRDWWRRLRTIGTITAGFAAVIFMMWLSISQLYLVISTGQLHARSYGYSELVSFQSDTARFLSALGIAVLLTTFGLFILAKGTLKIREWCSDRRKP